MLYLITHLASNRLNFPKFKSVMIMVIMIIKYHLLYHNYNYNYDASYVFM